MSNDLDLLLRDLCGRIPYRPYILSGDFLIGNLKTVVEHKKKFYAYLDKVLTFSKEVPKLPPLGGSSSLE